jgi:chromosome segregation ATPase
MQMEQRSQIKQYNEQIKSLRSECERLTRLIEEKKMDSGEVMKRVTVCQGKLRGYQEELRKLQFDISHYENVKSTCTVVIIQSIDF